MLELSIENKLNGARRFWFVRTDELCRTLALFEGLPVIVRIRPCGVHTLSEWMAHSDYRNSLASVVPSAGPRL